MKMQEAMAVVEGESNSAGFLVHFEWLNRGVLSGDYFPNIHAGEPPIATEEEAWKLAEKFAVKKRGVCVNLYVVRSDNFTPVPGYRERKIVNR